MIGHAVKCKVSKGGVTEIAYVKWIHAIVGDVVKIRINAVNKSGEYIGYVVVDGWLIEATDVSEELTAAPKAA